MAQNRGQTSKTQCFLPKFVPSTHPLASSGKDNLRRFYWDLAGKKYRTGNVFLFTENKDCSDLCTWCILKWLEDSRGSRVEETDSDEPTFISSFTFGIHSSCECTPNDDIVNHN